MISNFKNLTKKKIGGLLLILVIIIAFGFGGFGGGFNTGNQNNIAKINNTNISTQDFMDYLNRSGLSQQVIKENIDKEILEEVLSALISSTLLDLEIKELNLIISEDTLVERLKVNKNFQDENGNFQRTIYEKFLLTNNLNAPMYEIKLKNNILQEQLFTYISGGAKSPKFLVNRFYEEKNRKININYINLNNFYKKKNDFTDQEIQLFINENSDKLKKDYTDFSYVIITPKNLTGLDEFNQIFFDKIDDIENKIAKNIDFKTIINELDIVPVIKKNFINLKNTENIENIENIIYNSRKNKTEILENNGTYIFYQIDKIIAKLPALNNTEFKSQIKTLLFQKEKYEFNNNIIGQINKKEFNQSSFNKLGNNLIKKIKLNSITDNKKFKINSVQLLYSLPINSYTLIADEKDDVYIARIIDFEEHSILQDSKNFDAISKEASAQNKNSVLKSYDYLLNDKYKVVINKKTLDRVKNYFK
jgi:peptidyl-prolyl cis-trans isomerase D